MLRYRLDYRVGTGNVISVPYDNEAVTVAMFDTLFLQRQAQGLTYIAAIKYTTDYEAIIKVWNAYTSQSGVTEETDGGYTSSGGDAYDPTTPDAAKDTYAVVWYDPNDPRGHRIASGKAYGEADAIAKAQWNANNTRTTIVNERTKAVAFTYDPVVTPTPDTTEVEEKDKGFFDDIDWLKVIAGIALLVGGGLLAWYLWSHRHVLVAKAKDTGAAIKAKAAEVKADVKAEVKGEPTA